MESQASGVSVDDLRTHYAKCTSMRTWVTEDDLADTVLFLASPAASKISGQVIAIDGHTESMTP
jgi:enoyl-[acyl-carrier-protein] reductase (NADH)